MLIGVAFWVVAVMAVASGVAVFVVNSMARATYALALSFIAVGVQILLLEQGYLGLITILMMVMEMAVMAVYMVMFMGMNPALMPMDMTHGKKTAIGASVGAFVLLASGSLFIPWPQRRGAASEDLTRALGLEIMGEKMLVMAVLGPVMVATIVAGVVLATHRTRYDRFGDDLRRHPANDPKQGGVGR